MAGSWLALAALAASALGATILPERQVLEQSSCGRVWVTVHSPEIPASDSSELLDAIELNWDFSGCLLVPRKVGLFDDRPALWNNSLFTHTIRSEQGYKVTNVSLGEVALPLGWETGPGPKGPHCLWPWIGAGDYHVLAYNCLKIQPTWMEDNAELINNLTIGELVLPGTHNAGAWRFKTEHSGSPRDYFVLCQDRSVWAQLVHGIRYLDFRIAYYDFYNAEEDKYWLNHDLIRVRPLLPLLREIRMFLDNTKEVVFLDAHRFPVGFYHPNGAAIRKVHLGLLSLIQRELGPHVASAGVYLTPGSKGPTLQTLRASNKRLLFSYVDSAIAAETEWLWPRVPHLWANENSPVKLFEYLDKAIALSAKPNFSPSPLHSAMAQTTMQVLDVIFLGGSIRTNADNVNRNVTTRLLKKWRKDANIVATDFFLGNDVIDVAIMINKERGPRRLPKLSMESMKNVRPFRLTFSSKYNVSAFRSIPDDKLKLKLSFISGILKPD